MSIKYRTVDVEITGTFALLQHRFGDAQEKGLKDTVARAMAQDKSPRDIAEAATYRDEEGYFYLPMAAVLRCVREAGSSHKMKGTRKSVKYVVPAAIRMLEETAAILTLDGKKTKLCEVDSRSAVNPHTKGRVMTHRARWNEWKVRFQLKVNVNLLPIDVAHKLLEEGGEAIGVGAFRPEKGGPFGCFRVTKWEEQKEDTHAAAE